MLETCVVANILTARVSTDKWSGTARQQLHWPEISREVSEVHDDKESLSQSMWLPACKAP